MNSHIFIRINIEYFTIFQSIAGTVEVISIIVSIFVVLKVGIRRSLIAYMLIPGILLLCTNLVPLLTDSDGTEATGDEEHSMGVVALAMIGEDFYRINYV